MDHVDIGRYRLTFLFFQLKANVEVTLAEMEEHVMTITTPTPVLV